MNTAHSYIRFSTKQQASGDSFRRQTQLAMDYCLANDLTLSSQSYQDLGVSAFHSSNALEDSGLGQFLVGLNEGKVATPCTLLVENLDRLSRDSVETALTQFMNIIQAGVTIVTLFDNHVYKKGMTVVDYLTAILQMQRAHDESLVKSKRVSAAWEQRRKGLSATKPKTCPFWMDVSDDKKSYILNDRVELVHRIYAHANDGLGSQVIAKMLNAEGIKAPRGGNWSDATITKTLNNIAVLGQYQPRTRYDENRKRVDAIAGEPIKDFYPAIMDEEYFFATQATIKARSKTQRRGATKNHLNVIKGVASCGHCGSPVRLKQQGHLYYLQCNQYHLGACQGSNPINLRFLNDWLNEIWLSAEYAPVTAQDTPESRRLKSANAKLELVNETLKKLVSLVDDDPDEIIMSRILEKKAEKKSITAEIAALSEELAPYNLTNEALRHRHVLVKTAFMTEHTEETIKARCQLSLLLNQLKGFKIHMDTSKLVTFEVITAQNESKVYHSAINPYHVSSKHIGKIWSKS